jgi:hypothetical protein
MELEQQKRRGFFLSSGKWFWLLIVLVFFESLSQHLGLFFQLSGPGRPAFAFIVSPLAARRFPSFQSHNEG